MATKRMKLNLPNHMRRKSLLHASLSSPCFHSGHLYKLNTKTTPLVAVTWDIKSRKIPLIPRSSQWSVILCLFYILLFRANVLLKHTLSLPAKEKITSSAMELSRLLSKSQDAIQKIIKHYTYNYSLTPQVFHSALLTSKASLYLYTCTVV